MRIHLLTRSESNSTTIMSKPIPYYLLLLLFGFLPGTATVAMDTEHDLTLRFTQGLIHFQVEDGQVSNVVQIKNNSKEVRTVRTAVRMEKGWELLFAVPQVLQLKPNGVTTFLTLDIVVPSFAAGGTRHDISVDILNEKGHLLQSATFQVQIPEIHSWEAYPEHSEVFIPNKRKQVNFSINVRNTGNMSETLEMSFLTHPNIEIAKGPRKQIELDTGADTILTYTAHYIDQPGYKQRLPMRFLLENDHSSYQVKGYLYFLLLDNEFDHHQSLSRNAAVELFSGNIGSTKAMKAGMRAYGKINTGNSGEIDFSLEARDITAPSFADEQTRFSFSYSDEHFEMESNQHFISATYRHNATEEQSLAIGASQFLQSSMTQLSLKHQRRWDQLRLSSALDHYLDPKDKRQFSTSQLVLDMPLQERNNLYLSVQNLLILDQSEKAYQTNAQRYLLRYEGRHSMQWNSALEVNYSSPKYELTEAGLLQALGYLQYKSRNLAHQLELSGNFLQKPSQTYERGRLVTGASYAQTQMGLNYSFIPWTESQATLGGRFQSNRQSPFGQEVLSVIDQQRWAMQVEFRHRRSFWIKMEQISLLDAQGTDQIVRLQAQWRQKSIGLSYDFQHGNLPALLSQDSTAQFAANLPGHSLHLQLQRRNVQVGLKYHQVETQRRLLLPMFVRGRLYRRSLSYMASAHIVHDLNTGTTTSFARANLDWRFSAGWHVFLKAQLTQKNGTPIGAEVLANKEEISTRIEFGLRKTFRMDRMKNKGHRLLIKCFKDDNGNGRWDEEEEALPDVRVHLTQAGTALANRRRFQEAAVFSATNGKASFKSIPAGRYQVMIFRMGEQSDSYIPTTSESLEIDLMTDQELLLPFGKGQVITGKLSLERDEFSALGEVPVKGIRIHAVSATGRAYQALTDREGRFTLYVPHSDYYLVSFKNPFEEDFDVSKNNCKVNLKEGTTPPSVELGLKEANVEVEWN